MKKSLTLALILVALTAFSGLCIKTERAQQQRPTGIPGASPEITSTRIAAAQGSQEVPLGTEIDQCSGSLSVGNRDGGLTRVQRGRITTIDVAIDGNGYWYWQCGNSLEKSRGSANYRQRVKRLKVFHSRNNREITWKCFDLR